MSKVKMVKKIFFVHSPIQKLICKKLIESNIINPSETVFVFSRGCGAIQVNLPNVIRSDVCLLNDVRFCLGLLRKYKFSEEIFLPHSLSFLYEASLRAKSIKKINYVEEGTGTLFFANDWSYSRKLPFIKRVKVFFKKIYLIFLWLFSFDFFILRDCLGKGFLFPNNSACFFIDSGADKFGNVYLLDFWKALGDPFCFLSVDQAVFSPRKKVFFSIGNVEMSYSGFWRFAVDLCTDLLARGYSVHYKLHPGVTVADILRSGGVEAKRFVDISLAYDCGDDELGLALINDGFQAAVSSFSSFFIYSNASLIRCGNFFPVLIFGNSEAQVDLYYSMLPCHSVKKYIFRSADEWRACFFDFSILEN